MRSKCCLIAVMLVVSVLWLQGPAPAEITRCSFDVWTTAYPSTPLQLGFYVVLEDNALPPTQAFSSVIIYNPDGTVLRDYSADYWQYYIDNLKWFFFYPTLTGPIQTGTYKIVVKDKESPHNTMRGTDNLTDNTPLEIATLINPPPIAPGQPATTLNLTDTIQWTEVPGAKFYRLLIHDDSGKESVFDSKYNEKRIYTNSFNLPPGILIPGRNYSVRIEARDSDKNCMRRSRTNWIPFRTNPPAQY
jgi:hypothetical protein